MGMSTDALLWYGVLFSEEYEDDDTTENDRIRRIINGPDDPDHYVYYGGDGEEWLAEHPEVTNVEFLYHQSIEYPVYALAVKGTVKRAYRGSPQEAGTGVITERHWDAQIQRALVELGMPTERRIGWWLASVMG